MKTKIKHFIGAGPVCVAIGLSLLSLPAAAQSQTPFEGSFLLGNNLMIKPLVSASLQGTNLFGGTNEWVRGGIVINSNRTAFLLSSNAFNVTNTSAITDVGLWYDRDGSTPLCAISAVFRGVDARSTNTLIFKFVTVSHGASDTDAQNKWQFQASANGTTLVSLRTNIPTGWFQGGSQVRLASVESADGSNVVLHYFALKGYKP